MVLNDCCASSSYSEYGYGDCVAQIFPGLIPGNSDRVQRRGDAIVKNHHDITIRHGFSRLLIPAEYVVRRHLPFISVDIGRDAVVVGADTGVGDSGPWVRTDAIRDIASQCYGVVA